MGPSVLDIYDFFSLIAVDIFNSFKLWFDFCNFRGATFYKIYMYIYIMSTAEKGWQGLNDRCRTTSN